MNASKFSNFFFTCPIFKISGRSYNVDIIYSDKIIEDYIDGCLKQAIKIHLEEDEGDILIFLTGQEDIEISCLLLNVWL